MSIPWIIHLRAYKIFHQSIISLAGHQTKWFGYSASLCLSIESIQNIWKFTRIWNASNVGKKRIISIFHPTIMMMIVSKISNTLQPVHNRYWQMRQIEKETEPTYWKWFAHIMLFACFSFLYHLLFFLISCILNDSYGVEARFMRKENGKENLRK